MNAWETCALNYQFSDGPRKLEHETARVDVFSPYDAMIYPGLYSTSGLDVMGILSSIYNSPLGDVQLPCVDAACPILICDLHLPDQPIVYASEPFLTMTGYSRAEVMGRNCRFLQVPGGHVKPKPVRRQLDKDAIRTMRRAVEKKQPLAIKITNYKKDGTEFTNMLTMIPVMWSNSNLRYSVGLLKDLDADE